MNESFSLKDHLFNPAKITRISQEIQQVYPDFQAEAFSREVSAAFGRLELKARIFWITECLRRYLPEDYRQAVGILLQAQPAACDPSLNDDDFGEFIYAPYSEFVALYGCNSQDLDFSLAALKSMTTRFSAEGPIRVFLNAFPAQTLSQLREWARDEHYHVRRLVTEGTRPRLPWFQKVKLSPDDTLPLLDLLHADPTRYVTRSLANHLNDLSKTHPERVLSSLQTWRQQGRQTAGELDYITRHALRSLVKQGHGPSLSLLGYTPEAPISVSPPVLAQPQLNLGEALSFSFSITATAPCRLVVDYLIHFRTSKGTLTAKVFKLKSLTLTAGQTLNLQKNHPLRVMTTRKLYAGEHFLELQINGQSYGLTPFQLSVSP